MSALIKRVQGEFENFKKDVIENNPPEDVFAMAYEICWRKEILYAIENIELTGEQETALLATKGNLSWFFYDEWLCNSETSIDDLYSMIIDFANECIEGESYNAI